MMRYPIMGTALLVVFGQACKTEPDPVVEPPTFHGDVAPILSERCASCHTEGGMNPDTLFAEAATAAILAPLLGAVIESGAMPPFYAEESDLCPNPWGWKHDPRLTEEEEATVLAWVDAGGLEGDPDTAVPVPEPPDTNLADVDLTLFPETPWTTDVRDTVEDEFICFSMDPGLDEQQWLSAFQVVPEELEVVHHVLVGIDESGESAELAGEDGLYECFGGFGVDATFIGGWIPGASPIEMPEHSALRLSPDARIVMQMHYHLTDQPRTDGTGLAMRWAEGTPVQEAYINLIGNASNEAQGLQAGPNDDDGVAFYIPPGESAHTETMAYDAFTVFPRRTEVFLVANHMHYVGTDMRMWIERGSEEDADPCLLHTPRWDFDWQQFYQYDLENAGGPVIYPDDTFWVECAYDNTLDNPSVADALAEAGEEEPIPVTIGEGSLDEMCIGVLGQVIDVEMGVEAPTQAGEVESFVTSAGFGFEDTPCTGPASVAIEADGTLEGGAACGLDVLGLLATLEFSWSGTISDDGNGVGSGEVTVDIIGVAGEVTGSWEGEWVDGFFETSLVLEGSAAGEDIAIDATVVVQESD